MKFEYRRIIKTLATPLLRIKPLRKIVRDFYLSRRLAFPSMVQVEATNACNARCVMCPHDKMTRNIANLDFELLEKVVKECAANQEYVFTFLPNHFGEPLLNPNLTDYIAYVRDKLPKVQIGMFTNGSLLSEERSLKLIKSGLDLINVSFDGYSKETYEKIRIGLSFDKVAGNVAKFIELRNQLGFKKPSVNLAFVAMSENVNEVYEFKNKWGNLADSITIGTFCNWGGEIIGEIMSRTKQRRRHPCTRLWSHMLIFVNGDVPLCCQDYNGDQILGNVSRQSVREVWHGEPIEKYRRYHLEGRFDELPLCNTCNFWEQQNEPIWWWNSSVMRF